MKILVTGAEGFIGSHLVERLVRLKHKVRAFVLYNSFNSFGWLDTLDDEIKKKIDIVTGDIRDEKSVKDSVRNCDAVIHLAALIGIPYSYYSPQAYIKTNLEGTYNILEAARHMNCKNIIITSTSEVYGSAQYLPIDEAHPINSQSPYAASKVAADQLALSYFKSFNTPVKIIRPFNVYGPRQSERAIIPTIINQTLGNNKKISLGNLEPCRDFNYIDDAVDAFIKVMKNQKIYGDVVNVGTNKKISVRTLSNEILKLSKNKKLIEVNPLRKRPKLSEVSRLQCDNRKIKKLTKWKPNINLTEGLRKTIEWFKKNKSTNSNQYII